MNQRAIRLPGWAAAAAFRLSCSPFYETLLGRQVGLGMDGPGLLPRQVEPLEHSRQTGQVEWPAKAPLEPGPPHRAAPAAPCRPTLPLPPGSYPPARWRSPAFARPPAGSPRAVPAGAAPPASARLRSAEPRPLFPPRRPSLVPTREACRPALRRAVTSVPGIKRQGTDGARVRVGRA